MLSVAKRDIAIFRDTGHIVEQSSRDIWSAVCETVREAVAKSGRPASMAAGIGFDATCSLVVVGEEGTPLAVGPSEDQDRNIIVWMDHRAIGQAERINELGHDVLKYVGGRISPEMETPKLLWLKENRPETFASAWQFFDLADYLSWRATGDLARSTCTLTCKWTYLAHERRWDADYFRKIGLGTLADEDFARIGQRIVEPGTPCGCGLTVDAAAAFGLPAGVPVAAGMIDAHAGGIGTVGVGKGATSNLAYVFGTSSCTMTTTRDRFSFLASGGPIIQPWCRACGSTKAARVPRVRPSTSCSFSIRPPRRRRHWRNRKTCRSGLAGRNGDRKSRLCVGGCRACARTSCRPGILG